MYIAWKYGAIYWKTACLNVDAGLIGDSFSGSDYGAIASATTKMKKDIALPDVNTSEMKFSVHGDKVGYGLASISGINQNDAQMILDNKPYTSLENFIEKVKLTNTKMYVLIKSGAFNNIENDNSRNIMIKFLKIITPLREKLTTTQLPKVIKHVPEEYSELVRFYNFKKYAKNHRNAKVNDAWGGKYAQLTGIESDFDEKGNVVVDSKALDKWFNKNAVALKDWLKTEEATKAFQRKEMSEIWQKYCYGDMNTWFFEALSFYPDVHEISTTRIDEYYKFVNFVELPTGGKINDKGRETFKDVVIAGTVVDKDPRGLITLVTTTDETVTVRVNKKLYQYYNNKVMSGTGKDRHCIDDSWFVRGTRLIVKGHRKDNEFKSIYKDPMNKILEYGNKAVIKLEKG